MLVAAILVLFSSSLVSSFPNGAPQSTCESMTPSHGVEAQTDPSPYTISVSSTEYSQGQSVAVTIDAPGTLFKGFFLQARAVGDTQLFGTFNQPTGTKIIDCPQGDGDALTHDSRDNKTNLVIEWTAPDMDVGPIEFRVTIVQEKEIFWVGLASDVLNPVGYPTGEPDNSTTTTTTEHPTPGSTPPPLDIDLSTCAREKSCYRNPADCAGPDCDQVLTWRVTEDTRAVTFELAATVTDDQSYVAVGFSSVASMANASVVDCLYNRQDASTVIQMSFNAETGYQNTVLNDPSLGLVAEGQAVSLADGRLSCTFTRLVSVPDTPLRETDLVFDLRNPYFFLIATGRIDAASMQKFRHDVTPLVSSEAYDVTDNDLVNAGGQSSFPLVIAHGCLMILAWMVFASVGVLMPRYFKPAWPKQLLFGKQIWFMIHQPVMTLVLTLTLIAFILIFVDVGGYADYLTTPHSAHPILGIIVTLLCIANPIMAMFRCGPTDPKRPIFNWAHFLVGQSAHILGAATLLLGVNLPRARMPHWSQWVVVAYIVWHALIEVVLQVHQRLNDKGKLSVSKVSQYALNQQQFSSDNVLDQDTDVKKPGSKFKTTVIGLHFIGVLGCGITLMVLLAQQ